MEKLIIDTDLGFDCDDAGALALANIIKNDGAMDVLAVTHSVNKQIGGAAIRLIDTYYGNPSVPVGVAEHYAIDVDRFYEEFYAEFHYADCFPGWQEKPSFYKLLDKLNLGADRTVFPAAVEVIEQTLLKSEDQSVTFVGIGQANNIADCLEDIPVQGGGMTRRELFYKKIKRVIVMCGRFIDYEKEYRLGDLYWKGEFNVLLDISSSQKLFAHTELPIYVLDFDQGADVLAGSGLQTQADNPVRELYLAHGNGERMELPAWDLMTVMFASGRFDDMFSVSRHGCVVIDDNGKSVFSEGCGNHCLIMRKAAPESFSAVINRILQNKSL